MNNCYCTTSDSGQGHDIGSFNHDDPFMRDVHVVDHNTKDIISANFNFASNLVVSFALLHCILKEASAMCLLFLFHINNKTLPFRNLYFESDTKIN